MIERIGNIGNYYGGLSVKQEGLPYFWAIDNYNGYYLYEMPKELYKILSNSNIELEVNNASN